MVKEPAFVISDLHRLSFRCVFLYVQHTQQSRHTRHIKEIKGDRNIHNIRDQCTDGSYKKCEKFRAQDCHGHIQRMRAAVWDQRDQIKDLTARDSNMAIASYDPEEDYYLVRATNEGSETLQTSLSDARNNSFPPGAEVVKEHLYIIVDKRKRL